MINRVSTTDKWSAVDYPENAAWRVDSATTCHYAIYNRDGVRIKQGADRSTTPTAAELDEWDAQAATIPATLAGAGIELDTVHNLYIRWTPLPRSGRSRNHATGEAERGVSCYDATINPLTGLVVYADSASLPGAAIEYLITGADCYLVTGTRVGAGSDGEPLIANARVIGQLTPTADGFRLKGE